MSEQKSDDVTKRRGTNRRLMFILIELVHLLSKGLVSNRALRTAASAQGLVMASSRTRMGSTANEEML